ncbi:MAG: hypothetical protein BGO88_08505 [Flavobacterium sp. 38-13]|uniref:DUF6035 family protein n=1 Tax=Flavobacterium sp. 38-13 TaxID=1896168 RepID=UPI0009656453|nr:DUF6035 family protein [Flavobacterium sp. 38-13]OJX49787.1 MAG: hypothetical protein BGO88_08505 [Flavobacterium sp. 38-13]
MRSGERAIVYAFDTVECKNIDLEKSIGSQKEGFDLRDVYNSNTSRFICVECGQKLIAAHSSRDNVYFRHLPNSEDCLLKDGLDVGLFNSYREVAFACESPRHKELKQKIGELLKLEQEIDRTSIDIDSKFILTPAGQKRRPDVYCEYKGLRIAFEIQLSYLPLHYIKHRYEFYRDNGIYLIWIIDFLNSPKAISTFQRDIKYVWDHQNLFRLDESQKTAFQIDCHFKQPYIHLDDEAVYDKWNQKLIRFGELKFDSSDYSCYYLHHGKEHKDFVYKLSLIKEEKRQGEEEERKKLRKDFATKEISELIEKISRYRKNDYNFYSVAKEVDNLGWDSIVELNKIVDLNKKSNNIPLLLVYIKEYKSLDNGRGMTIVEFLLSCLNFKFDISANDLEGNGIIQYLYKNTSLDRSLYKLKPLIFERKYKLKLTDKEFLIHLHGKRGEMEYCELSYYAACDSMYEREIVRRMLGFLFFVESAKRMEILGSNVKSWVQYTVFILSRYKTLWKYIKQVLTKTGLGAELQRVDSKGTIKRKVVEFGLETVDCEDGSGNVLFKIHPDIFH